jgi:hypothetical protein
MYPLLPKQYSQFLFLNATRIYPNFLLYYHKNTPNICSLQPQEYTQIFFFTAKRIHSIMCPLLPQEYTQFSFFTATRIHPNLCLLRSSNFYQLCDRMCPKNALQAGIKDENIVKQMDRDSEIMLRLSKLMSSLHNHFFCFRHKH